MKEFNNDYSFDFPGGEIEFIGRAMTREERAKRRGFGDNYAAYRFAPLPAENENYIPIEDLVAPSVRPLLNEKPLYDWEDDE